MTDMNIKRLQDRVEWRFTVALQGKVSRYGTFGAWYYKQYLPGGLALPQLYPPRRISKMQYERALRFHEGM